MRNTAQSAVLAMVLLTALAGCIGGTTPPSRYYLLASDPGLAKVQKARVRDDFSLAVGPVAVPSHLDRLQIVTRKDRHQLQLAEFDLWAEPLNENLVRILVENLSLLLGTDRVFTFAEKRGARMDMEVAIDVERIDALPTGHAELVARWTVFRSKGRKNLFTRRSRLRTTLKDGKFTTLAAAMSRNASELSMEIAVAIRQLTE
jgi:uncharacterized protein